jgi:hypothetical protein
MTAAQKKARDNFKKAIAYRKKTGCSLKQAFAHVKGATVKGLDKVVKKGNKTAVIYSKKAAPKLKVVKQGKLFGIDYNVRLTRINNDVNGNPRYVAHFLDFINNEENSFIPFSKMYEYALKKAKKIGGKKYHNKQYGGGIVFQSYNTDNLSKEIIELKHTTPKIKI